MNRSGEIARICAIGVRISDAFACAYDSVMIRIRPKSLLLGSFLVTHHPEGEREKEMILHLLTHFESVRSYCVHRVHVCTQGLRQLAHTGTRNRMMRSVSNCCAGKIGNSHSLTHFLPESSWLTAIHSGSELRWHSTMQKRRKLPRNSPSVSLAESQCELESLLA